WVGKWMRWFSRAGSGRKGRGCGRRWWRRWRVWVSPWMKAGMRGRMGRRSSRISGRREAAAASIGSWYVRRTSRRRWRGSACRTLM
ncbi:hypothetical protein LTR48_008705, partial [Friedmanniomyces endolithicus]